jgi:hypothetical protein
VQLTNSQYTQLKTELEQIGFLQQITKSVAVPGINS